MHPEHTEEDLKELASQLRCPQGERGLEMANQMAQTNTSMLEASLPYLGLHRAQSVLELGPGSCRHLPLLLSQAEQLSYCGLDISELMVEQAQELHRSIPNAHKVRFLHYDGVHLPFEAAVFDRVISVNTFYFFEEPKNMFTQIAKVLKSDGLFVLTFQEKSFLESLPFTKYGFRIYEREEVERLLEESGFRIEKRAFQSEETISKLGEKVTHCYHILQASLRP